MPVEKVTPKVVTNDALQHTLDPTNGGARLPQFREAWEGVTSDSWTLNIIRKGYLPEFQVKRTTEALSSAREVRVCQEPSEEYTSPGLCGSAVREEGYRESRDCVSKSLFKRVYRSKEERSISDGHPFERI